MCGTPVEVEDLPSPERGQVKRQQALWWTEEDDGAISLVIGGASVHLSPPPRRLRVKLQAVL